MDAYTLIIVGILIFAIQALIAHSVFTLHANEEGLRETVARQGEELIRLREEIQNRHTEQQTQAVEEVGPDPADQEETLEELIARYERDEVELWGLPDSPQPDNGAARMHVN